MADSRFHHRSGSMTLMQLAALSGSELSAQADPDMVIDDVAPLDQATGNQISFFDNIRYKEQLGRTAAGACIIAPDMQDNVPDNVACLLSQTPYKAYALVAQAFYPEALPQARIDSHAVVDDTAQVAQGCVIEAGAVIGAGAEIGDGVWIEAGAVIGRNVKIGAHSRIGANATVTHSLVGDYVRIYPGCRIGQDGFGFAIDPAGHVKVPQLGRVIIEDHVEIGANTTIDRGAGPDTVIGQGTWIDNLVQIGHNVKLGRGCVIVAQVGISGSTVVEDFVVMAGQAGITGHLHIGKGAKIGAQSGVMRDVPAGEEQLGSPAQPLKEAMKQIVALKRLTKKGR